MLTECSADSFGCARIEGRAVISDAGALLVGPADRTVGLMDRFAACFRDTRRPGFIEHEVRMLVGQRVFGIALGYEALNDHDVLRHDPAMAVLAGKLEARRKDRRVVKVSVRRIKFAMASAYPWHDEWALAHARLSAAAA